MLKVLQLGPVPISLYRPSRLVNIGESLREREKLEAVQVFQLAHTVKPLVRALGFEPRTVRVSVECSTN